MDKTSTCCFTGHWELPAKDIECILIRLNHGVEKLIEQGVTTFISGGRSGFDQIAASLIVAKKEMGGKIRLLFVLPCKNQDDFWGPEQKEFYHKLLPEADEVIYVSQEYRDDCIKKQKHYMIDRSAYCICAYFCPAGRTSQTIRYARKKGLKIINVAY